MTAQIEQIAQVQPIVEWRWTLERYHQAIELGLLTENDRVELLFGKLIEKMPTGNLHAATVEKLDDYFRYLLGREYQYREEKPVTLPNASEPEPDYVIAYRKADYYASGHPTPPDILLLVEVSDATLYIDRNAKARAYALAGIKEYWIVNIPGRKVEVHLNPLADEGIYSQVSHYSEDGTFESPFAGEVRVGDLLVEEPESEEE